MTSLPDNPPLMTLSDIKLLEPTPSNERTYTLRVEVTGSNNVSKIAGEILFKIQASDQSIHTDATPESIIVFTLLRNRRHRRERVGSYKTSMSSLIDMQKSSGLCVLNEGELELSFIIKDTLVQEALDNIIQEMRDIHLNERGNWSTFFAYFKMVKGAINSASGLHHYLQQAWNVFLIIPDGWEAHLTRNSNINQLCERLKDIYKFILDANRLPVFTITQTENLKLLFRQTLECVRFIKDYIDNSTAKNILKGPIMDNKIQEFQKSLSQIFDVVQKSLNLEMDIAIYDKLELIHNFNLLGELPYAANAGFQTNKKCLPGTREKLIKKILDWVHNPDTTQRVLVLSGQAGMGKSAIAHTIHEELKGADKLTTSIFCFNRSDQSRSNFLFSTISRNLADHDPSWLQNLIQSIEKTEIRKSLDPTTQFDGLIVKPSKGATKPAVIIIDALDESGDRGSRKILLDLLFRRSSELPQNYRLIITTRPESDIEQQYEEKHNVFRIHIADTDSDDTRNDIRQFISFKLSDVAEILDKKFNVDWRSELAEKAQGLFQWANLACLHIDEYDHIARLRTLLSKATPASLYEMYHKILDDKPGLQDKDSFTVFQTIIRAIVVSRKPLSLETLQALFEPLNDDLDVKAVLVPVRSLFLGVDTSTAEIRPLHTSLFDFFISAEQKPKVSNRYYIDMSNQASMTYACLRLMNRMLRFNICNLKTSHLYNKHILDFDSIVKEAIPPHLSYACCFWAYHLKHSCLNDQRLLEEIRRLMNDKLLYFFEALSLLGEVDHGCIGMVLLQHKMKDKDDEIFHNAANAYQFGHEFGEMMEKSTPHIYLSALPFTPKDSFIYKQFIRHYPQLLNTEVSRSLMHPPLQYSIMKRNPRAIPSTFAFSPKDVQIATGFDNGEFWVWDYITGEITYQWRPQNAGMLAHDVVFSPNGEVVHCCFEDGTIVTWNAKTNETTEKSYEGITQGKCSGCTISSDGCCIAFALKKGPTLLHDTRSNSTHTFEEIGSRLTFSPDGAWLGFGQGLWNTCTRTFFSQTETGRFSNLLALTNNYAAFALASSEDSEVWDLRTNTRASVVKGTSIVKRADDAIFTPDARYLLYICYYPDLLRIYDVSTGDLIAMLTHRSLDPTTHPEAIAVSPDCKHVALRMSDETMRVLSWDALIQNPLCHNHDGEGEVLSVWLKGRYALLHIEYPSIRSFQISDTTRMLNDHELLNCRTVVVSPEDDHWSIAYTRESRGLYLWNIDERKEITLDDSVDVYPTSHSLAFSPTGDRLITGKSNGYITIWDIRSRQLIMAGILPACHLLKALDFSLTGTTFIVAYISANSKVLIEERDCVSGNTWRGLFEVDGPKDHCIRFLSANDKHIVYGLGDVLEVLDTSTGIGLRWDHASYQQLSPNKKYAAWARNRTTEVEILDLDRVIMMAGEPLYKDKGFRFYTINFSTDSTQLWISRGHAVDIWDIEAGKPAIRTLQLYGLRGRYNVALHGYSLFWTTKDGFGEIWDLRIVKIMESLYSDHLSKPQLGMLPENIDSLNTKQSIEDCCSNSGSTELLRSALKAWDKAMFSPFSDMDNGWVLGPHGELLFWVPPRMRGHLWRPGASYIGDEAKEKFVELDFDKFVHGTNWSECRIPCA